MSQTARTLEIPQPRRLRPIMEVGKEFGLLESELISYGPYKAKISLDALKRLLRRSHRPGQGRGRPPAPSA
jgi:formate--tetrahydrofolate ligase